MGKDPLIGQVLHDTHEVVRLLGEGGMGTVYEARHVRLRKQRFAVKVLHGKMTDDPTLMSRFQREAEIATEIGHPNIVYVLDFYETDNRRPCMVMEYLEGQDLLNLLKQKPRLSEENTLDIVQQVASALKAVHERGIVHRDLKPANIFLAQRPDGSRRVKVLDFGISKIRDSSTLTGTNMILGTPHYMSPEQGEGEIMEVDHRTDIFALGTITYQMLSGQLPFNAPSLVGVIRSICDKPHKPISTVTRDLGPSLDAFFEKALAKQKEDRFQNTGELVDALEQALMNAAVQGPDLGEVAPEEPAKPEPPGGPSSPTTAPAIQEEAPAEESKEAPATNDTLHDPDLTEARQEDPVEPPNAPSLPSPTTEEPASPPGEQADQAPQPQVAAIAGGTEVMTVEELFEQPATTDPPAEPNPPQPDSAPVEETPQVEAPAPKEQELDPTADPASRDRAAWPAMNTTLGGATGESSPDTTKQIDKTKGRGKLIGIAAAALLILALGGFFALSGSKDTAGTGDPVPVTEAEPTAAAPPPPARAEPIPEPQPATLREEPKSPPDAATPDAIADKQKVKLVRPPKRKQVARATKPRMVRKAPVKVSKPAPTHAPAPRPKPKKAAKPVAPATPPKPVKKKALSEGYDSL